jgi:hypothetical protein
MKASVPLLKEASHALLKAPRATPAIADTGAPTGPRKGAATWSPVLRMGKATWPMIFKTSKKPSVEPPGRAASVPPTGPAALITVARLSKSGPAVAGWMILRPRIVAIGAEVSLNEAT